MMSMNNASGRTSTIFIILIALLLISSTAIGFFMYQKENQMRKGLEVQLEESKQQQDKLSNDLKDTKKQVTLLTDKNKEADAKINNLMDEIELNEGLRKELKKENSALKDTIEAAKKEKEAIKSDLEAKARKLQEGQNLLKVEQAKVRELLSKIKGIDRSIYGQDDIADFDIPTPVNDKSSLTEIPAPEQKNDNLDLDKIVIGQKNKGRILSVDKESDFVICNLGSIHGVKVGDYLAVYKSDQYLGDVKISRVQDEMSAADFVAPLSSRMVHKNDSVVLKQP